MSEPVVTEADRERARQVVEQITSRTMYVSRDAERGWVDAIAPALAAEREKARAPFLALAAEYERHAGLMQAEVDSGGPLDVVMRSQAFRDAAASIRRAAEGDA